MYLFLSFLTFDIVPLGHGPNDFEITDGDLEKKVEGVIEMQRSFEIKMGRLEMKVGNVEETMEYL